MGASRPRKLYPPAVTSPAPHSPSAHVREGLAIRLLAPQGLAQAAHLVAVVSLLVLLRDVIPVGWLLVWAAVITFTIALRASVTYWAARHRPAFEQLRRHVRQTVCLTGLAWGLGGAALVPSIPFEYAMVIMATFGGLVAGGGSTMMADAVAFRCYSLSMILPITVSVVLAGADALHLVPAFLSLCVAGFMVRFNSQAFRALVEHLETRAALEEALANIQTLGELLPICASCKKIRDDQGYWSQIEEYISEHSDTSFSHGICPDCIHRLYPEFATDAHPTEAPPGRT